MSSYIKKIGNSDYLKIDTPQMIEVDRLMMEHYHIDLTQMMENAGRCLAIVAREIFMSGDPQKKRIAVFAGTGGNGGGAMVCARRLHSWGAQVDVFTTDVIEKMTPVPKRQLQILNQMGVSVISGIKSLEESDQAYDLLIDGVIGYSVKGDPYGVPGAMIEWMNKRQEKVLSLDTPSGLDLTSGTIHNPTVKADATLTLAMPKQGLFHPSAKEIIGKLYLGDISVPPQLYSKPTLGLEALNVFQHSDIVQVF